MLFLEMMKGAENKGMLAVQSIRNTQMVSIFNASIAIFLNTALTALTNNSYNASLLLNTTFLDPNPKKVSLYCSASFLLLSCFFCSSMALAFFMDANFLLTALSFEYSSSFRYSKVVLERGNLFALIGNRLLWVTFPLLLWMLVPCRQYYHRWP
ncbi:LOW QUALITY PROTEIN: hypothetical protein PanWU01x14_151440 [Parasponia andersonii]|uniref:Uncharacterized protein n=1 Tax=Parasponia andersonii TaxID=3476 RepID=A0A2P5CHK0_PARAD|nr:LOW QUALITY PROTEIN: hypothetical protein PanWU01x14_151440 [Parasponia andersonii]